MEVLKARILRYALLFFGLAVFGLFSVEKLSAAEKESQYAPGRVIVCIRGTGDGDASGDPDEEVAAEGYRYAPGGLLTAQARTLLSEGEDLMELTGGETLPDGTEGILPALGGAGSSGESGSVSERRMLRLIESDVYDTEEMIELLSSLPEVLYAEPDYAIQIEDPFPGTEPVSIRAAAEEGFSENSRTADLTKYQYCFGDAPGGVDVPDWNNPEKKNAEGVVVAVMDTGVRYDHPDLKDVMWDEGLDYPSLRELGGGKYGFCAAEVNSQGVPCYSSDDPMDDVNHGTHCAGVVAAAWNAEGVSGAANGAKIMAIKIFNEMGGAHFSDIVKGFSYVLEAKRSGVNVQATNNSYCLPLDLKCLNEVLKELSEEGIVSIFASSNEDINADDRMLTTHALHGRSGVVMVNACDALGRKVDFSNYGVRSTDLFAPGWGILSTISKDQPLADLLTPVKDSSGRVMMNDFESEDYLTVENIGDQLRAEVRREEDALRSGNHVLKYTAHFPAGNQGQMYPLFELSAPVNTSPESTEGLKLVVKFNSDAEHTSFFAYARTKGGEYAYSGGGFLYPVSQQLVFELPEDTDFEDLTLQFRIMSEIEQDSDQGLAYFFDDIYLSDSDEKVPYEYDSGTSMAAPVVTGEAAILAAAFPEDDAPKRVARILGSVKPRKEYSELCVTGGLANVRNALAEDYIPVLDSVWQEDTGALAISGYFFGVKESTSVSLTQEGKEFACKVKEVRRSENHPDDPDAAVILVDPPEGLKSGEVFVRVTNSLKEASRQTGSRYLSLFLEEDTEAFYQRISLPRDDDFLRMNIFNAAMLKDEMYFDGQYIDDSMDVNILIRYGDGSFSFLDGLQGETEAFHNLCVFDGKIWCLTKDGLYAYDPEKNIEDWIPIEVFGFTPGDYLDLFYTGKELLCFNTVKDKPTEVWKLDPWCCSAENIINLRASYGARNLYGLRETEEGTEIYVGLGALGPGKKRTVMEKLLLDPENGIVKCEYVSKDILPEGCIAPQNLYYDLTITGVGTKDGIYLIGGFQKAENSDRIEADNWYFDFNAQDKGFQPGKRRIASDPLLDALAFSYKGKVYFYGYSKDIENECLLAFTEEETWDFADQAVFPDPAPRVGIEDLKINGETALTMDKGQRGQLSCTPVYPADMKAEERPPLLYTAGNDKLIKINPITGEYLAYGTGSTQVTASCGDKTVTWKITVLSEAQPGFLPETLAMQEGEQTVLMFDPGYATGNEKVSWISLDKKVAAVKNGLVTTKKAGTTLIRVTVKDGKKEIVRECLLTVTAVEVPKASNKDKSTKLSLGKSSLKTTVGNGTDLKVVLSGKELKEVAVEAVSSNPNVLQIGEKREETNAGNKQTYTFECNGQGIGTATVIVKSVNQTTGAENRKLCRVTVTAPAKEILVAPEDWTTLAWNGEAVVMKQGAVSRMIAQTDPEASTDTGYTWKAKGSALRVKNGVVYANKESKKDKNGEYIPDSVTVKCGKATETIWIIVEK